MDIDYIESNKPSLFIAATLVSWLYASISVGYGLYIYINYLDIGYIFMNKINNNETPFILYIFFRPAIIIICAVLFTHYAIFWQKAIDAVKNHENRGRYLSYKEIVDLFNAIGVTAMIVMSLTFFTAAESFGAVIEFSTKSVSE